MVGKESMGRNVQRAQETGEVPEKQVTWPLTHPQPCAFLSGHLTVLPLCHRASPTGNAKQRKQTLGVLDVDSRPAWGPGCQPSPTSSCAGCGPRRGCHPPCARLL